MAVKTEAKLRAKHLCTSSVSDEAVFYWAELKKGRCETAFLLAEFYNPCLISPKWYAMAEQLVC